MASTKKRRRTKHRGNAAGVVESRGRTGRRGDGQSSTLSAKEQSRQRRLERMNRKPSWRSAVTRALIATALFAGLVILVLDQPVGGALAIAGFMLLIYIPLGYYTDLFIWNRRQKKGATKGGAA